MNTQTLSKLCILIMFTIQISCIKEKDPVVIQAPPITLPNMLECHRMVSWDSLTIHTQLLGKWEWEYIQCYWKPEEGNYQDFQGLLVEFKSDNTLEVKVNGQTTQTSIWQVINLNDGNFSINVNPIVVQLPGRILFCTERVLFSDSYTDGCDNYFKRKD